MKINEISVGVKGEHLIAIRKMKKKSQAAIARAAGITPAYMCLLERGKAQTLTNTVANRIALALEVEPEALFSGYVEPTEDNDGLLTEQEREEYAERYLDKLRDSVWFMKSLFFSDFEEAYSEGLVVFARALYTYRKTSGSSFPHYVDHALEGTFKSERRKMTRAKRAGETYSLDCLMDSGRGGREQDFYNIHASPFDLEDYICKREECREAVKTLSPERRRDPYIAELLEAVGL